MGWRHGSDCVVETGGGRGREGEEIHPEPGLFRTPDSFHYSVGGTVPDYLSGRSVSFKGTVCPSGALFILTGVIAGLIYLSLIYAITAAFKHIGRAIFRISGYHPDFPGSTGTFPVEMMGGFYRAIYQLMPFTYSNTAMRECMITVLTADTTARMVLL